MTRLLDDRPPCVITVGEIGTNQWAALSEVDEDLSGATNWVDAIAKALDWARNYGDAVELAPYEKRRVTLLLPAVPICGRRL